MIQDNLATSMSILPIPSCGEQVAPGHGFHFDTRLLFQIDLTLEAPSCYPT